MNPDLHTGRGRAKQNENSSIKNENTRMKMTTLGCFFFSNRMKMNTRIKMRTLGPVVSFFLTQKCTIREENDIRRGDFRKLEVVDR